MAVGEPPPEWECVLITTLTLTSPVYFGADLSRMVTAQAPESPGAKGRQAPQTWRPDAEAGFSAAIPTMAPTVPATKPTTTSAAPRRRRNPETRRTARIAIGVVTRAYPCALAFKNSLPFRALVCIPARLGVGGPQAANPGRSSYYVVVRV